MAGFRTLLIKSFATLSVRTSHVLLVLIFTALISPKSGSAQITPDNTTGTQVQSDVEVRGLPSDLIEGGTTRNDNLFHSFQDFNVETGRGAYFANPAGILNIFSRVTGGNGSNIDGTLGVLGDANLFLLNPNGIIFGPNARLDIAGSFTASTADAFTFANGVEFSATDPQAPPLLTLSITPGVQLGQNYQGDIENAGNLEVAAGQQLTLHGMNIRHTGSLSAPGGAIGLFGQTVGLLDDAQVDVSDAAGGGTVLIGGTFQGADANLSALRTYIGPDVEIRADALQAGNGGMVAVWSEEVTGFYGNISARGAVDDPSSSSSGDARGGVVEVSSLGHLIFRGMVDTATPFGQSGVLLLDPTLITIANGTADGAADGPNTFAGDTSGLAGQVLSAPLSAVNDLGPITIYESELEGLSGNTDVILQATDGIQIDDLADNELLFAAGTGQIAFIADANADGVGDVIMQDLGDTLATNGRNLSISGVNFALGNIDTTLRGEAFTTVVDIDAGGPIPASGTSGTANFSFTVADGLGSINDVDVRFSAAHTWNSDLTVTLTAPDGTSLDLFNQVGGSGDNFQDTVLDDEALTSITSGSAPFVGSFQPGEGGQLAVFDGGDATGTWNLAVVDNAGGDSGTLFQSGDAAPWGTALGTQLLLTMLSTVEGDGGSVALDATGDVVANQIVTVGMGDAAQGGNVAINAGEDVILLGDINTSGGVNGGDISIFSQDFLLARNLDSSATTPVAGVNTIAGSGGNIMLSSNLGDIITTGSLNSSASASSFSLSSGNLTGGNGGNISISTTSGSIYTSGNVDARSYSSTSGDLIAGSGGNISVSTISGNIYANGLLTATSRTSSSSGAVTGGNGGAISVSTMAGDIETNVLDASSWASSWGNENVIGGDGGDISVSTGSGRVSTASLFSLSEVESVNGDVFGGNGGDITLSSTQDLTPGVLLTRAIAQTQGSGNITGGNGGDIRLSTTTGDIRGPWFQSRSTSHAFQSGNVIGGNGGNIDISTISGDVNLSGQSSFSTSESYTGTVTGGDGGNVAISTISGNINTNGVGSFSYSSSDRALSTGGDGGDIAITTVSGDLGILGLDSFSHASAGPTGNGGDIVVSTQEGNLIGEPNASPRINLRSFAVSPNGFSSGDSGSVTVEANNQISNLELLTVSSTARAGEVNISGFGDLLLDNVNVVTSGVVDISVLGSSISFEVGGIGQSGDVIVTGAGDLTFSNSNIESTAQGVQPAGNVSINSPGQITFQNNSSIASNTNSSGAAGSIAIESDTGILLTGTDVFLSAITNAAGNAGTITLDAPDVTVEQGAEISTATNAAGTAGNIFLTADNFNLTSGATVQTNTSGSGNAGTINLDIGNNLTLDQAAIAANTSPTATGRGGNVDINAGMTRLNNSSITVNAQGQGVGGNIFFASDSSLLLRDSNLSATTASANGGNIDLSINDVLLLSDRSQINATAGTVGGNGNGGNINIGADFLIAAPQGQNRIIANAFQGTGGNINISVISLFGERYLDISASSQFGLDGTIVIDSPDLDPTQSIDPLPANLLDAGNQIADACAVDRQGQSEFVVTGRGGLPPMPTSRPSGLAVVSDLGNIPTQPTTDAAVLPTAQGVTVASNGGIGLTTDAVGFATPETLLQAAADAYHRADYAQAAMLWEQAATMQADTPISQVSTLSNLALAYHHLGDWEQAEDALAASRQRLSPDVTAAHPELLAQVLSTEGSLHLAKGDAKAAIQAWQQAAERYHQAGDTFGQLQAQLNQTQAWQSLGFYHRAQAQLDRIAATLTDQPPSELKASALLNLGNVLRARGESLKAQQTLEAALTTAQSLNQPALTSTILLNLGHGAQANPEQALAYYQDALEIAPTPLSQLQAQISQFDLLISQDPNAAQALWTNLEPTFQQQLAALPASRDAIYAQLHLAQLLLQPESALASPQQIMAVLTQASQDAQTLNDPMAQAYTLGYQAQVYGKTQQWAEAESLTEQALQQAQTLEAPEMVYQWAWQLGRFRKAQAKRSGAIEAYNQAVNTLQTLRADLVASSDDVQFNFRDGVEPVYRELVKLLLQGEAGQATQQDDLKQA
ncbi:MAG: filamentous hemagglutinin N-terminal domain-containing protein, partial [Cyanobacteria bacterium P01_A01_bin.123]